MGIIWVLEGEEEEIETEKWSEEIMTRNLSKQVKNINSKIQAQWTWKHINSKETTPRCIKIKLRKTKGEEKNPESS